MGNFFAEAHLRCSKTRLKNALRAYMSAQGYRTDNRTPELAFEISPGANGWIVLRGEAIFDGMAEQLPAQLSGMLGLPVLHAACFDSDCLYLTLHHGGASDSACVGVPYDMEPPEPDSDFWQAIVPDYARFCEILRADYVFAEEALLPLGELIGFGGDMPDDGGMSLGFSRAKIRQQPLVSDGPTLLGLARGPYSMPTPYALDRINAIHLQNFGGPSRGMEVTVEAAFPQRSDLRFEIYDACLRPFAGHAHAAPERAAFECISREGPRSTWRAVFPNFEIPEGVNPNYTHPAWRRQLEFDLRQSIVFNYRLSIPEHLNELTFRFIPLEHPGGAYIWRLQDCSLTPQALAELERRPSRMDVLDGETYL